MWGKLRSAARIINGSLWQNVQLLSNFFYRIKTKTTCVVHGSETLFVTNIWVSMRLQKLLMKDLMWFNAAALTVWPSAHWISYANREPWQHLGDHSTRPQSTLSNRPHPAPCITWTCEGSKVALPQVQLYYATNIHALNRTIIEYNATLRLSSLNEKSECNSGSYLRIQSILFLYELWNPRSAVAT